MTEIRIRGGGKALPLGDVPFLDLDKVVPMIKSWGVYDGDYRDADSVFGQFTIDETGAYFEVVVNE